MSIPSFNQDNLPASKHAEVAVVGAGVVGSRDGAGARAQGRLGRSCSRRRRSPALAASGTNSGILHTGFDSVPGELETELILRSAALRDPVLGGARRAGAALRGAACARASERSESWPRWPRTRSATASRSCCASDGALKVPGEAVTDPVAYTLALAAAAARHGAELRTGFAWPPCDRAGTGSCSRAPAGERVRCRMVVNCAGLHADEVARLAGDDSFEIYPRKGEFLVFDPPPASRSSGSCCRCRRSARRACWCSRRSTARWSRARPPSTRRTRATGRCGREAREEILPKAMAMWPPLEGVRADRGVRRAAARRARRELPDRPLARVPAARQRRGDPLHRPDRVTRDRGARLRDRRRARRGARRRAAARARRRPLRRRPVVAADGRVPSAMSLLLGIDEGTSAVKAVLFDERPARRSRGAAREGRSHTRGRAGSSRTPRRCSTRSSRRSPRCWTDAPGEVVACGLDHQGESVLAWDAESGAPADARSSLAGQALAGGARPARGGGTRGRGARAQRHAARPLLLGGKARLAARARRGGGERAREAGTLRMGTVDSFLCDRLGAGFATDPRPRRARSSARPTGTPRCSRSSACRARRCRRSWTPPATSARCGIPPGPSSCRCARAASTSRRRSPAPAASSPAGRRRPTAPACSCSPTRATSGPSRAAACCRRWPGASTGEVEWALDGGVFTAGALLEWLSRDLGLAPDPAALAASAAEVEDAGGVRVLPALAGRRRAVVAPEARAVFAGMTARDARRRTSRALRSRRSPGGWPTSSSVIARDGPRRGPARRRRPDARPTAAPASGRRGRRPRRARRRRRDRRGSGGARRGRRRGLGLDARDRRADPGRGAGRAAARRRLAERAHAEWREFVQRAVAL